MKISEVCTKTELTEKTVRFYVEKGLLKKEAQIVNGRKCRDYNEEDVAILKDISVLRRAGFSIQGIADMQTKEEELHSVLSRQIIMLDREAAHFQQINEALKTISNRESLSWRDIARHIRNYNNKELENATLRWPEEELADYKKPYRIPGICWILIFVLCLAFALTALAGYMKYNRPLTTIITISDVIFHDKWVEDGRMYAQISCTNEAPIGYDSFFASPQTLEIEDPACYEALKLGETYYSTLTLRIEIPYGVAKQNQLLVKSSDSFHISIEDFLLKPEFIKKYCKVVQVIA